MCGANPSSTATSPKHGIQPYHAPLAPHPPFSEPKSPCPKWRWKKRRLVRNACVGLKRAMQLLNQRYRQIRFAQVPERISVSRSDGDHQRLNLDAPMKPEQFGTRDRPCRNGTRRSVWVSGSIISIGWSCKSCFDLLRRTGRFSPESHGGFKWNRRKAMDTLHIDMRSAESYTGFYSHLACFVNIVLLSM